jgi:dTDP-4-amino-4,6-dideoxygalactose transaminase
MEVVLHPFDTVRNFEKALAEYAGSKYAVAVDSCTSALLLACAYLKVEEVVIPKRTYPSVPCSIIHAGGWVKFEDLEWSGIYQLKPYPIYDGAKRFRRNMYVPGSLHCLSFHAKKLLPIGRGGAILTDDPEAVEWFKVASFDGRHPGVPLAEDKFDMIGWNVYMGPEQAARGHLMLSMTKDENEDQEENPPYPDLSQFEIFHKR